jgi:hypothetical protein
VHAALSRLPMLVLAGVLASGLRPGRVPEELEHAAVLWKSPSSLDPAQFYFDPDYAAFLEDVRHFVPAVATVALVAPLGELYVYGAAYHLAPRRVVDRARIAEASFVAIYERAGPDAPLGGLTIRHGRLLPR